MDFTEQDIKDLCKDFLEENGIEIDDGNIQITAGNLKLEIDNDLKLTIGGSQKKEIGNNSETKVEGIVKNEIDENVINIVGGDVINQIEGSVTSTIVGSLTSIVGQIIQLLSQEGLIDIKAVLQSIQMTAGGGISMIAEDAIVQKSNDGDLVRIAKKNVAEVAELGSINRRSTLLMTDKAGLGIVHNIADDEDRIVLISELINYVQKEEVVKDLIGYIRNTQGIDLTEDLIDILNLLKGESS